MTSHQPHLCHPSRMTTIQYPWSHVDRPTLETFCRDCGFGHSDTPDNFPRIGEAVTEYSPIIRRHAIDTHGTTSDLAAAITASIRDKATRNIGQGRGMWQPIRITIADDITYDVTAEHHHWTDAVDAAWEHWEQGRPLRKVRDWLKGDPT